MIAPPKRPSAAAEPPVPKVTAVPAAAVPVPNKNMASDTVERAKTAKHEMKILFMLKKK